MEVRTAPNENSGKHASVPLQESLSTPHDCLFYNVKGANSSLSHGEYESTVVYYLVRFFDRARKFGAVG
jgi:hypothetical protein